MGVDATIYAMQSKTKFYFDRVRKIEKFWDMQHGEYDDCQLTYDLLRKARGVSYLRTLKFLELTIAARLKTPDDHPEWDAVLHDMAKFVKAHPKDEFMIMMSGTDEYYDNDDKYQEWKP